MNKSSPKHLPETKPVGLHHLLRIYLHPGALERMTSEVLNYCLRTGCSEVLLFTTSYDKAPSFVSLEEIERYTYAIQPCVQRLRSSGLTVSVNVLQTLGHVYFPMAMQEQFPFQRRVYADGRISTEGACPLCPRLRDWAASAYGIYAKLKPQVLFVDDDFRTAMQGTSCFCDLHLHRIGQLSGREVTREEVVEAIHDSHWPSSPLRNHYFEATTEGYCELAAKLRAAVHAVSPGTRLGLMTAFWPLCAIGTDLTRILKALCGEARPLVRPQNQIYSEGFLRDFAGTFINPDRLRATLPEDIEYWPEIENYQYSLYAKSAQATFMQMAAMILQGFDHLALNVFDMFGSPFGDTEPLIALLEKRRPYLNALHNLVPENRCPEGVQVFTHPNSLQARRVPGGLQDNLCGGYRLADLLPNLGLPVTHHGPSPWVMLLGDDVLALSDPELDALLRRGVLMDATAADALALRGQNERIGVRVGDPIPLDELGFEEFVSAEFSPSLHGRCFPLRPVVQDGDWRRLTDLTGKGQTVSCIRNYRGETVGPAVLLTENDRGERFGVLAWSGRGDRHLLENLMRPEQFREAFAWIANKRLAVTISQDTPYLWLIQNRSKNGDMILGIINLSTDTYPMVPLLLSSENEPRRLRVLRNNGRLVSVRFRKLPSTHGQVKIEVRHSLVPLGLAIFEVSFIRK